MKVLFVKYICREGQRAAFFKAIKKNQIDVLSQSEKGNIRYEYSYSAEDKNVLILNEVWKDDDSLKAHGGSAHLKKLRELKAEYVDEVKIEKYKAEPV